VSNKEDGHNTFCVKIRPVQEVEKEMISPRIFENKALYALEADRIKFGWRADGGVAMVRNDRNDLYSVMIYVTSSSSLIIMVVLRIDLFRDLRA
jgi:hypothetical protein